MKRIRLYRIQFARRIKWFLEKSWGRHYINYKDQGFINFIDVGAIGWLPYPWNKKKNAVKIRHLLRFEPQENSSSVPNVTTSPSALWKDNCERKLYIFASQGGGASLLEQNYEYVRENYDDLKERGYEKAAETWFERSKVHKTIIVECTTLDSVLNDIDHPFPYHFLKIDAQGVEYEILLGAENFLQTSCIGLHLELFNIPLFKDMKILPEVVTYLNKLGFELYYKFPAHGTFNSQNDCVFIKSGIDTNIRSEIIQIYKSEIEK